MRIRPYVLLTFLATGAAAAVGACSNEVATGTGGPGTTSGATTSTTTGGAGGAGGATSTATSTTSTSTSTTTTTTTGAGGQAGDPKCIQTCAKGDMCGFGLCDQFGVDCTNPPAQLTPCLEDCIIAADCGDLAKAANMDFNTPFGACVFACQGMGSGGTGGGGAGGAPPQSCQDCAQGSCAGAVQDCATDFGSGCLQWLQCIQGCNNNPSPQCFVDCDNQFPNAKAKYTPLYACICASCTDACAAVDACSHVPDGG
jgi:hypothetical protein